MFKKFHLGPINLFARRMRPAQSLSQDTTAIYADASGDPWHWFSYMTLSCTGGLLLIAIAFSGSRVETNWANLLFWCGFMVIILPPIVRISSPNLTRQERISMVVMLATIYYLIKVLYNPILFTFKDEFHQMHTTSSILLTGRLFHQSSILPVSPFFPGLSILTASLVKLGGLDIFVSGLIIIGIARIAFVLSLFLFYEHISRSSFLGSIATLLYISNPHFLLFDAQYSYESLALPLIAFILYSLKSQESLNTYTHSNVIEKTVMLGAIGVVVVTHHVSSYMLTLLLGIWLISAFFVPKDPHKSSNSRVIAIICAVVVVSWAIYVATMVIDYLEPWLRNTVRQTVEVLANERPPRELFRDRTGRTISYLVQVPVYASVLLIFSVLPFAARSTWKNYRHQTIALALLIVSFSYPVAQALRITSYGLSIGTRALPFIYVGLSFVLAVGLHNLLANPKTRFRRTIFAGFVVTLCTGTTAAVVSSWGLPRPYDPLSYTSAVDSQGIAAAIWTETFLGTEERFVAPFTMELIVGAYGRQQMLNNVTEGVWFNSLFVKSILDPSDVQFARRRNVEYLVEDQRLRWDLTERHAAMTSRDEVFSRLYDSGDVVIYGTGVYVK